MALLGGGVGGVGNPVGGSFTGPAEALEYVGDFAYATSGVINDAGTGGANATLLDFQMGSGMLVGTVVFNDNSTGGSDIYFEVLFNGKIVIQSTGGQEFLPWRYDIIIPPYTEVIVRWGAQSNFYGNCFLSGRVYH